MTTSLAQQLQKLAVPQAYLSIADARSRASILFDPKEAATKDRRAIYEIGLSGLLELSALNPDFKQFQLTLFDEAALNLERAVEKTDVTKLLDLNIAKFLRLLSPYFLLRPAHMCFEWLLRRFQVHEFNRAEVMALIFPYHETNTFVQVLQTMRLRNSDPDWDWLRPLQRPGVPLAKKAVVNRAANIQGFLAFVCKSTQKAVKELGPRANQLQAQINFYATVVVGALQTAKPVEEWHIATILESLLKGLVSDTVDFVAASYVIVAQLVARTNLKTKVCNALLERVANCSFERLHTTALLLLIWILDRQQAAQPELTADTLQNLVGQKWLISSLAALAKENVATQAICMHLMRGAVAAIQAEHAASASYQQFLDKLLADVPLSKSSAQQLINCFLDTFVATEAAPPALTMDQSAMDDEDTIVIDSDDEMDGVKTDFQTWYAGYLEKLERRYPEPFDSSVKEALSAKFSTGDRQKALKLALGLRLNTSDDKAQRSFEKLYHHSADWRLSAVQRLLDHLRLPKHRERSYQLLQECLLDRINDDSAAVVAALLTLPTADLVAMLGAEPCARILCSLLQRAQQERADWQPLQAQTVKHLTSAELRGNYDANLVLLALMPYLFPADILPKEEHAALLEIVRSDFCQQLPLLSQLKVSEDYDAFNAREHRQHFLDVIASAQGKATESLSAESLLQSVEQHGGVAYLRSPQQLTHLLLLLTACAKRTLRPAESLQLLQRIKEYSANFEFHLASEKKRENYVPLQLFVDFVNTLVNQTKFEALTATAWSEPTDELRLCLLLLDIIGGQVYAEREASRKPERLEWMRALRHCTKVLLPSVMDKLELLSQLYLHESLPGIYERLEDYSLLRVRGGQILKALLLGKRRKALIPTLKHVLRLAQALSSPLATIRALALDTLQLLSRYKLEPHIWHLVKSLLARRSELCMDQEQYSLILYTVLEPEKPTPSEKLSIFKLKRELLALICDQKQPAASTAALLAALKHMNNERLLTSLLPLGLAALERISQHKELRQLPAPYSDIYKAVVERFEGDVALNVLLRKPLAWQLCEQSFALPDVYIELDKKLQPLPCALLNALSPQTYERLQPKHRLGLIQLIVQAATQSDNDSIFLAAHKLFKHCALDCQPLVGLLSELCARGTRPTPSKQRRGAATSQLDLTSVAWKQGLTMLELLEHKKQLLQPELLIPPLFELLQSCLALEEHSAAEYPKQLILSSLLHCCQVAQAANVQLTQALPESCFRIELVVQCLRNSQNPQTQQHALLFLTRCAALYPQQVLHKIVEIFTFVGSTLARHDDAFSLHIINNVVESIIPILLQQPGPRSQLVLPVLKVFSDICTDVPVHRRLPLYGTLFGVLDPRQHLWQFLCIVFEAQILDKLKPEQANARLEFARELTLMFEQPEIVLETCVRLLDYIAQLPQSKAATTPTPTSSSSSSSNSEQQLFDVRNRSCKQLRHYKYIIMDYLSTLTSSSEFQAKLATPTEEKSLYQALILRTLAYVSGVNQALLAASGTPSMEKYWRVMANHVHDVLDNAIGLLSPEYLLSVIAELLQHELLQVRIKVLELLNTKLSAGSTSILAQCASEHFGQLFKPLGAIIDDIVEGSGGVQQAQLQQTALRALQLLAAQHGRQYLEECRALLATLTRIAKRRANVPKAVLGNVVLTLVEICASLKAHALAQLPKFMPQLTELLKEQAQVQQAPDYLCSALVTALHKLFAALPLFLGPYLVEIISALSRLHKQLGSPDLLSDKRAQALLPRISEVCSAIAQGVELRILVPSCAKTYDSLLAAHSYEDVAWLMQLLLQCIQHNSNAQLQPQQAELAEFFLQALQLRLETRGRGLSRERLAHIEASIIEAFVAWTLKLSESSFRPLHSQVHKWALQQAAQPETRLTYFLLTNKLAETLKSLVVLFAGDFIPDAARLLHETNSLRPELAVGDVADQQELLAAIISTLHHVFLHNSADFVNSHRFNTLLAPLIDQLENELVLSHEPLQQALTDSIAQLAVAVSSDVLWKQLNGQVLLKTRTQLPEVRILAFNSCVAIARKLGESFSPLLPETMPFIAELLEDEHERVEKNTRRAVQELETILGEQVQKYL